MLIYRVFCSMIVLMPHPGHTLKEATVTATKPHRLLQWFAGCGDSYVHAYLPRIDIRRLASDRNYGLKAFLFMWAYERNGAPRAYRIAAIKAISSMNGSHRHLPSLFKQFCRGKLNPHGNPALDPRIGDVDIPAIVKLVGEGALEEAFFRLDLKGVAHKLRAFFIRDVVTLLNAESRLTRHPERYLWCQPIDAWVRMAAEELCPSIIADPAPRVSSKLRLSRPDRRAAWGIVQLSLGAGVSPLRVNQGIWYFSSNVVADQPRLRSLLRSGDPHKLDDELALMRGFLPAGFAWD